MALFQRFGHANHFQSLLIPQVAETDIFAQDIGIGNIDGDGEDAGAADALLLPDEGFSTMQDMALGTLTELRPRGSGRLQLVAEFDTRLVSCGQMRFLLHVYARMLQEVAGASRAQLRGHKEVTVGEVLNSHVDDSSWSEAVR